MPGTRRRFLATVGASIAIAGCQGEGGGTTPTETRGAAGTSSPMESAPATVSVTAHEEYGEILVDGEGMTLYMFDTDTQGDDASTCSGSCLDAWPPLSVDGDPTAGADVSAELTTFEREDGDTQVAADGWPLYYFASDEEPDDVAGQGVNDVWWVLRPDGTPVRGDDDTATEAAGAEVRVGSHDEYGDVLVDGEGMTLYMFDTDEQGAGESACSGDCLDAWPPLTTDGEPAAGDDVTAELSTFEREDGDTQVAADGWPLYYFANDEESGDVAGQGVNDVWWVLGPDGSPGRSSGDGTEAGPGPYSLG